MSDSPETNKIIGLRSDHPISYANSPDADAIARLEEMLEQAKSGHLRAFSYAYVDSNRAIHTGWNGHCDAHDMTCGVSKLFYRFLQAETAQDE